MFKAWLLIVAAFPVLAAAAALEDPTRPSALAPPPPKTSASRAVDAPVWRLESTLTARARRLAIINGVLVQEGDRVQGARVVEVRSASVLLETGGGRIEVHLGDRPVKTARR